MMLKFEEKILTKFMNRFVELRGEDFKGNLSEY